MFGLILYILFLIQQIICFPFHSNYECPPNTPFVTTKKSTICGFETKVEWNDRTANTVNIYYGIPYALPPVGILRFKKPVPIPESSHKLVNATTHKPSCYQYNDTNYINTAGARMWLSPIEFDEDCLYLNVWVPQKSAPGVDEDNQKATEKLAVMVWIYGGSFSTGTAALEVYEGRYLAARQNIIVVSLNYRLGALGFTYLKNGDIPGNMGLWDQRMALKWVKENIEYFGGDSDKITIFGESAGAVSVSCHIISPWSQNFFRNAIMQSGSLLSYWGLENRQKADAQTKRLIEQAHCNIGSRASRMDCMRKRSAKELIEAHTYLYDTASYFSVPFPPVTDNSFLPYDSSQSFKNLEHLKPTGALMFGINKNEGSYFMLYAFIHNDTWVKNKTDIEIINETDYENKIRRVLDLKMSTPKTILSLTDFEYTNLNLPNGTKNKIERLEEMSSDRSFKCPTIDMARLVTNENRFEKLQNNRRSPTLPTYFYEFRYRTKELPWPEWMGTIHGLEIDYVFGVPFNKLFEKSFYKFNDEERRISDTVMQYWANFARNGDPNIMPNGKLTSDEEVFVSGKQLRLWPEFDNTSETFIVFNDDGNLKTSLNPKKKKCLFWRRWFPVLLKEVQLARKQKSMKCN